MRTGTANLPLHWGKAPRWLFQRMVKLAREITIVIVSEQGASGVLEKLSDPFWFQCFGCILGFDWHSSGVTTTVCGALKEAVKGLENELGLWVAGGKGGTSRKTPSEIEQVGEELSVDLQPLIYASKMSAKVDNNALQDGYQLYHHNFIFTRDGAWCVVQQGMNDATRYARRYHWLGASVKDYVCEPHAAICCDHKNRHRNLVAKASEANRELSAQISHEKPEKLVREIKKIQRLSLPDRHPILTRDINPDRLEKIFLKTYEQMPANFEQLLGMQGVGPQTIRALSLIAELVYGAKPGFNDPARFSFAHGGKDGYPYPVNRATYDHSIEFLRKAIATAKIGHSDKMGALKRLSQFEN
ncbi:DUF763 domain-containing protein [candidate division KSB1 bacterium]|nr:DUF763 domain-containing protein [candidate division KSB1 bacterium]